MLLNCLAKSHNFLRVLLKQFLASSPEMIGGMLTDYVALLANSFKHRPALATCLSWCVELLFSFLEKWRKKLPTVQNKNIVLHCTYFKMEKYKDSEEAFWSIRCKSTQKINFHSSLSLSGSFKYCFKFVPLKIWYKCSPKGRGKKIISFLLWLRFVWYENTFLTLREISKLKLELWAHS